MSEHEKKLSQIDAELSSMLQVTGEHIEGDYLCIFSEIFEDLLIPGDYPSIPIEILQGITHALANTTGYRVVLQAPVLDETGEPRLRDLP